MTAVLTVKRVTKRFKDFTALDEVSFSVKRGEIVGFVGANGAGKTTTISTVYLCDERRGGVVWRAGGDP